MDKKASKTSTEDHSAQGAPFGVEFMPPGMGDAERAAAQSAAPLAATKEARRSGQPFGADPPVTEGGVDYLARPDLRPAASRNY